MIRTPLSYGWLAGGVVALLLMSVGSLAGAYDNYVYDSLQRSRDALLGQRDELQKARSDSLEQIDRLNQKVGRIDAYLTQVDNSLRDVNDSLSRIH